MRIGQVVAIVVVRTVLAAIAVFGAVVLVLVPAGTMHRVLAFHHDFIASLEGSLTE